MVNIIVRVSEGQLEGEVIQDEFGTTYTSFKGIPYAEPPVGNLRFKAPQHKKPWSGVLDARKHGPICYQYDAFTKMPPSGSEDCLYLNVYTPDVSPKQPWPVMVWIHGGGYTSGSGNDDWYGPQFLMRHGVILVTFNYRLEILGFLSLQTEDIPGNAGMKDQVAALRWVKKNIASFGGDPTNITIFGESAGAGSVSYHLISPMTKGLFKRAIMQSGTANCWWANSFEPRKRAIALANKLGFESEDDKDLYDFFKSQPVEALINGLVPVTLAEAASEHFEVQFNIVREKKFGDSERFFYGDVFESLRDGIHEGVQVITGYCEDEGYLQIGINDFNKVLAQANNFLETFVPKQIALKCSISDQLEVGSRFKKFYFGNAKVSKENVDQLSKYYGAEMFSFGIQQWQKMCAKYSKNKTYFYKFSCKSERNFIAHVLGLSEIIGNRRIVCHGDDIPYLFPFAIANQKVDSESEAFKMIERVLKLWTNFAKYGNPTPDSSLGTRWLPYTCQQPHYLDIGDQLLPQLAPDHEEMEFWEDIFTEFLPHAVIEK